MFSAAAELAFGLAILGAKAFALFLMTLGAIDLHTHLTERKERVSK